MKISQDFKCFVGLHKYEVYKEEIITDNYDKIKGKVIISRCNNCGKLKLTYINTKNNTL